MFENWKAFGMLAAGAVLSFLIVYVPPFNIAFGTYYKLSPIVWLIPLAFGFVLWLYAILRTVLIRLNNPVKYSEEIDGLQMYPTRWSTGGGK